jgi:signal transduction histidine kinase
MQNKANCDEVDLNELVGKLAHESQPQAERKKQRFNVVLADVPAPICVDLSQVREAIDNIIGNAIKYTPDSGTVTVTMKIEGKRGVFEVKDTGYGVAPDEQARLFQPFFRASNARESSIEGTGLGLHLVKNIIERHGGKMRFESKLGEGSTFGFELPLQSN